PRCPPLGPAAPLGGRKPVAPQRPLEHPGLKDPVMITTPVAATTTPTPASTTTSSTSTGSTSSSDASLLGSNLNTFLTLLTTQLKNQDPTSPMDTNQFTQQLVEFSAVEQHITPNN